MSGGLHGSAALIGDGFALVELGFLFLCVYRLRRKER